MITVKEASRIILENTADFGTERIPIDKAIGRILAEDLCAERDFPPFHRVMMDGIAIRHADFSQRNTRTFQVKGLQSAGMIPKKIDDPDACLEVMTGAVLPDGTDSVIRYEDIELDDGSAKVNINQLQPWQNIHKQGMDRKAGEVIVKSGRILASPEIAIAATIGKAQLRVKRTPKTIIFSTGDELVEINQSPLPHQIRRSNNHAIRALLSPIGVETEDIHVIDDKQQIRRHLLFALENYDFVVMSGGVSKGKLDHVPEVLESLNVTPLFHRVKQRPGKPFWFGVHEATGKVVFALPGNPVSSTVCTLRYILPWLRASLGLPMSPPMYALLSRDVNFKKPLQYFLPVKLSYWDDGRVIATPVMGNGSGDLAGLVDTDGFLELPADQNEFHKEHAFPFIPYRS